MGIIRELTCPAAALQIPECPEIFMANRANLDANLRLEKGREDCKKSHLPYQVKPRWA